MGVCSDGSYGIEPGLMYSFPVTCRNGQWSIVQGIYAFPFVLVKVEVKLSLHHQRYVFRIFVGLKIDEFSRARMDATAKELVEEKLMAHSCLETEK